MFETIKISLCNKAALFPCGNSLIAAALIATLFSLPVPVVWAERFANHDIARALLDAPIVPQEAKDLASSFLEHTLPKLLTDDIRLARQLGFGESMNNTVTLDRALPLLRIYRNDVLKYATGKYDPLDIVNNTNNWLKNQDGKLIPKRIVFPVKNEATSGSDSYSWSSITLEQSSSGAWRIIQVGAPKLSGAIKLFETSQKNHFLLWIPDLNRHYLGQVSAGSSNAPLASIILTALFNDSLTDRLAGEQFEAISKKFIADLRRLYYLLEFPKKLRGYPGYNDQTQSQMPIQAR